jgi:O-antigen/teichoic acid export membrane protein
VSGPSPSERHSLPRATFLALQADVVTAVSALVVAIIVARGLGTAGRGVYFLAILAATMIALVGNMGLATTAIVYGAKQRFPLGELHGMAITFSLIVGVLGAALLLGFEDFWVSTVLGGVDHQTMILVALSIAPMVYGQIAGAMLTGMGHVPEISVMRIVVAIATPIITVPAVLVSDQDPFWPVAAWLATTIGFAAALGWYAGRAIARPTRPSRAAIKEATSFSLRGHVGTLAHQGFLRIDVLFVSAKMGDSAVGLYAQASVLAERMSTLGHAVYSSSAARLGSDPPAAAAQLAAELVRVLLLVMVPVAIVLALLSKPIMVVLFGSDFGPAAEPFAILLPGAVCLTLWYVVSLYIMSSLRRPGTTTLIQGLAFLISVPLYWVAIDEWSLNGAALVSTLTYAAVFAAGIIILERSPHVSWRDLVPSVHDVRHMHDLARRGLAALPLRRAARSR